MQYDPRCTCPVGAFSPECPVGSDCGNHPRSPLDAGALVVPEFRGKFLFLSNFYPWVDGHKVGADITVAYDGVPYPTSEHAFVAAKTLDPAQRRWATDCERPGEAKHRGRKIPLRPDWDRVKVTIMWGILMDKFCRNPVLRRDLLATRKASLFEGNTWGDTFWGVVNGKGRNELGNLLMSVRSFLAGEGVKGEAE